MLLYENNDYKLEIRVLEDKRIFTDLVSKKTGGILQKQWFPEVLIKKLYLTQIITDFNIIDLFS